MPSLTTLLTLSLFLCPTAATLEDQVSLLNHALATLSANVAELERSLTGAVLFYPHRTTCPVGFRPAHEYDGRLPVVGNSEVGRVSPHSLHDEPVLVSELQCERMISVSESGFIGVCQHNQQTLTSTVNLKDAVPSFSVLACVRENQVYGGN